LDFESAKRILGERIDCPEVFDLFKDYQSILEENHYFDQGDLYLTVLNLLKKNQLKLPQENLELFISGIYPLRPGHREILRYFKEKHSQMTVHVFYDEDYSQEEHLLDKAFEDLGSLADTTEYFEPKKIIKEQVIELRTPYHEIDFITDLICKQIKAGTPGNRFALVVPNEKYVLPLLNRFTAAQVSVSIQMPLSVLEFIDTGKINDQSTTKLIDQFRQTQNQFSAYKIRSKTSLEAQLFGVEFAKVHLKDLDQSVDESDKQDFINELIEYSFVPAHSFPGQLVITTPQAISAYDDRQIFFTGFCLENMVVRRDGVLFSNKVYSDPDFMEMLESPSFLLKLSLEKIKRILSCSPNILLTVPEFDFTDKPVTKLKLGEGFALNNIMTPAPTKPKHRRFASDYFQSKKKTFSLSELEEYLKCPYRYYAQYHLKLDRPRIKDIEPDPDVKGIFVHNVLQRLIQNNENMYLEGLEYELYRKKLVKKLGFLIQKEIESTEVLGTYHESVIEFFAYRVYKTIIELLNIEAENYKSAKKKTIPKLYEWRFGNKKSASPGSPNNLFVVDTSYGAVHVRGRIDRVDTCPSEKNFSVIDYKTGNAPTLADIKSGKTLQLPLYLMAVNKIQYPQFTPTGAYYYLLKTNEIKGFTLKGTSDAPLMHARSQLEGEDWLKIQETVVHRVGQVVSGIHEGKFDPEPQSDQLCRFCDFKKICGYYSS